MSRAEPAPQPGWRERPGARFFLRTPFVAGLLATGLGLFGAQLALTRHPKVALAGVASLVAGLAVLLEPGLGILVYYNLAFMRPHETIWGLADLKLTQTVSLFTLAAAALHFALRPDLSFLRRKETIFLVLLWLFLHLSAHSNHYGALQAKWLDYYNKMFLIYFVTLAVLRSERWLYALAWVIALSIGYLAVWANDKYFLAGWHTVHGPGRKGATYYDENGFAMILTMAVPFLWYLMIDSRKLWMRAGLFVLFGLAAHAVLLTFSRGGFLGLVASCLVLVFRIKSRKVALLLTVAGAAAFLSVTGPRYVSRILTIKDYGEDQSASGRLDAWEAGGRMMMSNPIFGVGFKRFVAEFPNYSTQYAREGHNSWVQLGAECGLIAVTSHIALVLLTGGSVFRVRRRLRLLPEETRGRTAALVGMYEATLVGYLVTGFFLSMEDFEFFYLLVAMAQILDRVTERKVADLAVAPA